MPVCRKRSLRADSRGAFLELSLAILGRLIIRLERKLYQRENVILKHLGRSDWMLWNADDSTFIRTVEEDISIWKGNEEYSQCWSTPNAGERNLYVVCIGIPGGRERRLARREHSRSM